MSASFYDLLKYAHTGIASADMTAFDKARALSAFGGGKMQTLTGVPPLEFPSKTGKPLISWSMKGNEQQTGTPTPDAPIMPDFCGKLIGTDWAIPLTCAGQTVPIYLGQTQTVRRIKKLVLDGTENWYSSNANLGSGYTYLIETAPDARKLSSIVCTHADQQSGEYHYGQGRIDKNSLSLWLFDSSVSAYTFKSYLADQYAAGTPVTVWYILAEPETAIVNEPLCKIGDYADELRSADAGVTIQTAKGQNTLTVDTELQPSSMTITYKS